MRTFVSKNADELSEVAAAWVVEDIIATLSRQDRYTIAMAGGNTPKKLYSLLASDRYANQIDWHRIHFFWGDERFVAFNDDKNNAKMAHDVLLDKVAVDKKNIHIMPTAGPEPEEAAVEYEKLLRTFFEGRPHTFDLVLLGLGNDSHTLSLFPGYDLVNENKKWVAALYLKEQKMYRITLTAPVVNMADKVAFLVSGGDKAAALYHVRVSEHDPGLYPAQIIQPFNGELYWFIDEAAAADL